MAITGYMHHDAHGDRLTAEYLTQLGAPPYFTVHVDTAALFFSSAERLAELHRVIGAALASQQKHTQAGASVEIAQATNTEV